MIYISVEQFLKKQPKTLTKGKRVFTNGCFDLLHPGHMAYLKEAKGLGEQLIVGLNSDASVKLNKGDTRPITAQEDRAIMLDCLQMVDDVILFDEETPCQLISKLKPNIYVKGGDYKKDEIPETAIVEAYLGQVFMLNFKSGYSTSKLIQHIKTLP